MNSLLIKRIILLFGMGKEIIRNFKRNTQIFNRVPTDSLNMNSRVAVSEINSLWNITNSLTKPNIREDGSITLIVKNRKNEIKMTLHKLAYKNNKVELIFKKLLKMEIIHPNTKLLNFLKLENGMWFKTELDGCYFNSGDAFMIIIDSPKTPEHPKLSVKKSIRKHEKQYLVSN